MMSVFLPAAKRRRWPAPGSFLRMVALLLGGVCGVAFGQTRDQSRLLVPFDFVRDSSAWLTSANAAALTTFCQPSISTAEVFGLLRRGGLTGADGSPKTTEAGAAAESFFRLSPSTVAYGRIAYHNFSGRQMGGSVFLGNATGLRPFDIVEDSLSNLGRKHSDTYRLTGAIGSTLLTLPSDTLRRQHGHGGGLSVGARVDYTAANYAKYKDLRHRNKLLDLEATAGVLLRVPLASLALTLGADGSYRRCVESLQFSCYGKQDKMFKSLIDYAAYTGRVEQFGNYGYTNNMQEMPLVDELTGFDVQLGLLSPRHGDTSVASLVTEFSYDHRSGYYGDRSASSVTLTRHRGHVYGLTAALSCQLAHSRHSLGFHMQAERLENSANAYREQKNDAGFTYYEYFHPVKTADKLLVDGSAAYDLYLLRPSAPPPFHLRAAFSWMYRKQTAYVYPYFRRQRIEAYEGSLMAERTFCLRAAVLTLSAACAYSKGGGAPFADGTFIAPSDKQSPPPDMPAWLLRDYEWLTASQRQLSFAARYAFPIPATRMAAYLRTELTHRKANGLGHRDLLAGTDRTYLLMAVGCNF